MAASSEPRAGAERTAECPHHGAFASRRLFGSIWTRCQACADDELAIRAQREAQLRAAELHALRLRVLEQAAIPARFVGRAFTEFNADSNEQRHALSIARDFADDFDARTRKGSGLIFAGRPGTGKTLLAACIMQSLLGQHAQRYTTALDLIRSVRDTWRRDSERRETELLDSLQQLDLLVIDEVGGQYGTEGEQTILFDVLDRRYREVRSTILLTNQDRKGFRGFVGERAFDRLTETCRWVPFDWDSYRPIARRSAL